MLILKANVQIIIITFGIIDKINTKFPLSIVSISSFEENIIKDKKLILFSSLINKKLLQWTLHELNQTMTRIIDKMNVGNLPNHKNT